MKLGLHLMEIHGPNAQQMEIDEPPPLPHHPPMFGPAMPTADQMNAALERIRELEGQVHALQTGLCISYNRHDGSL
jgi:hypothetical protein